MKLRELKKTTPATRKSSGTDDPSKYIGGWESYDKPQGINARQDRKVLAKESDGDINPDVAYKLLLKMSPTVRKAEKNVTEADPLTTAIGMTVAFISISIGGHEITTVGPLDINGAYQLERTIEGDIARSYRDFHPHGYTDGSGTIYMLDDWDIHVETCHSSQCSALIGDRMAAAQARKDHIANGNRTETFEDFTFEGTATSPLSRFAPEPAVSDLSVGGAEADAIKQSRKAPSKLALASAKALSARGKQPRLKPRKLDETIRRPFAGTLNSEYEIADDNDATIGYARVSNGVIETFDYLTEATQDYRGQIMSALLHQIVHEADRNQANLSILVEGMNGEIKSLLERFGFREIGGHVMKRNQGAIRPTSVPPPQGMVNRRD